MSQENASTDRIMELSRLMETGDDSINYGMPGIDQKPSKTSIFHFTSVIVVIICISIIFVFLLVVLMVLSIFGVLYLVSYGENESNHGNEEPIIEKKTNVIRIGIIGDQIYSKNFTNSYEYLYKSIQFLKREENKIDFVLHTGDVIESTLESDLKTKYFKQAVSWLSDFDEWFITAGDHDVNPIVWTEDSQERSNEKFFQQLLLNETNLPVSEHLYYSIENLRSSEFIQLVSLYSIEHLRTDPRWGNNYFSKISSLQLEWLQSTLKKSNNLKKKIIILHQPLWYNFDQWISVHSALVYDGNVICVIAGHFHYPSEEFTMDGIRYLIFSASGGVISNSSDIHQSVNIMEIKITEEFTIDYPIKKTVNLHSEITNLKSYDLDNEFRELRTFSDDFESKTNQRISMSKTTSIQYTRYANTKLGNDQKHTIYISPDLRTLKKNCSSQQKDSGAFLSLYNLVNPTETNVTISLHFESQNFGDFNDFYSLENTTWITTEDDETKKNGSTIFVVNDYEVIVSANRDIIISNIYSLTFKERSTAKSRDEGKGEYIWSSRLSMLVESETEIDVKLEIESGEIFDVVKMYIRYEFLESNVSHTTSLEPIEWVIIKC